MGQRGIRLASRGPNLPPIVGLVGLLGLLKLFDQLQLKFEYGANQAIYMEHVMARHCGRAAIQLDGGREAGGGDMDRDTDTDTDSGSGTNYASFCRQSRTGDLDVERKKKERKGKEGEEENGVAGGQVAAAEANPCRLPDAGRGLELYKRKLRRPERTSRAKRAPTLGRNDANASQPGQLGAGLGNKMESISQGRGRGRRRGLGAHAPGPKTTPAAAAAAAAALCHWLTAAAPCRQSLASIRSVGQLLLRAKKQSNNFFVFQHARRPLWAAYIYIYI